MKFTDRLIALFIVVFILLTVTSVGVGAAVLFPAGDWVYERITNDTEFEINAYKGKDSVVITPYFCNSIPITSVGDVAFMSNNTITKVTFSTNIYAIQEHAFYNCENLQTIIFEGNVNQILYGAFSNCTSLESINLEDTSITYVSSSCFMNCDSLTEITLPETVVSINEQAFAYCDSLSKITIPESVTAIHENAFYNSPNVVIYCYKDSAAHVFAETNSIEYVLLEPVETYILGDADNDGTITVLDATFVQLVLAQKTDKIDGFDVRADSDKDGVVSVMDATLIQQHVADLLDDSSEIGKSFEY